MEGDGLAGAGAEAEKALIGAWLVDAGAVRQTVYRVRPEDFASPRHGKIAEAVRALVEDRQGVDVPQVAERLTAMGALDYVGGLVYLTDLLTGVALPEHAGHYAEAVAGGALLRRLAVAGKRISALTEPEFGEVVDPAEAIAKAEALLAAVRDQSTMARAVWFATEVEAAWSALLQPDGVLDVGWPTGLRDLDALIGGLRDGEMCVIGARPSNGKSALALHLALRRSQNGQVLLASLEMGRGMLSQRAIAWGTGLNGDYLRRRVYGAGTLREREAGMAPVFGGSLQVLDVPGLTTDAIAAEAWRIQAQGGLHMIVVDYLTLLGDTRSRNESRVDWTTRLSGRLQRLAREIGCPVVVLSQLNRGVEAREDKHPQLSDLRDSGAIEQDADLVLLLHRPGLHDPSRATQLDIDVAKQRNGAVGMCHVRFQPETGQFSDLARGGVA